MDGVVVVEGDITDLSFLMELARRENVTRVLHLAAYLAVESNANPMRTIHVNIVGSGNVLDTAVALDMERVCYASTVAALGTQGMHGDSLAKENPSASPMHLYGASKRTVEITADAYRDPFGLDVLGIRPVLVYGMGRYTGGMGGFNSMIRDVALGRPTELNQTTNLSSRIRLIYNTDIARVFVAAGRPPAVAALQRPGSGGGHLAGCDSHTSRVGSWCVHLSRSHFRRLGNGAHRRQSGSTRPGRDTADRFPGRRGRDDWTIPRTGIGHLP